MLDVNRIAHIVGARLVVPAIDFPMAIYSSAHIARRVIRNGLDAENRNSIRQLQTLTRVAGKFLFSSEPSARQYLQHNSVQSRANT